jgi:hypothetical protein
MGTDVANLNREELREQDEALAQSINQLIAECNGDAHLSKILTNAERIWLSKDCKRDLLKVVIQCCRHERRPCTITHASKKHTIN